MADQPEALRLADWLDNYRTTPVDAQAAAELRRLVAENALLHERHHFDNGVLKELLDALKNYVDGCSLGVNAAEVARAAIAKAEGQK